MEIVRFQWKSHSIEKLATHDISPEEVEEIRIGDGWMNYTHVAYPDQVRIIGPTADGRLLTIALERTDDPTVWRPVTGWTASVSERRRYQELA